MKHQGFEQSQIWIELRDLFKVSNNEYMLLDVVRREQELQGSGWCNSTAEQLSSAVGIKKRNIIKMTTRLVEAGLMLHIERVGSRKVSEEYNAAYANRERMAAYIREISTTTK